MFSLLAAVDQILRGKAQAIMRVKLMRILILDERNQGRET
jgi:hypothetical protein